MANIHDDKINIFFQQTISTFCDITNIDIFFLSDTHKLINRDRLFNESQEVCKFLSNIHAFNVILYPVIINKHFSGSFFLTNTHTTKTDHLMLREYLESTASFLSNQNHLNYDISILSPIKKSDFQKYYSEINLIESKQSVPPVTPPPSISRK
ncbi:hypothetical protein [Lactobacillus sp. 3B(2020)]|uniref:hypothetical protein n=1 Tax=Lactobacillus sp. 3B(2020) TaxID=2695882 RepID=UPI0015DFD7F7|nr:hypothetical protein [Lactobacillus sp. 3B(2020)]QLL69140.1 hypothetical protein GTO83_00405 [Lactobacillus sp. 3B(2020)]